MAKRGEITDSIQIMAKQFMGREICQTELRLMAYVDYVMKNSQKLEPRHMNGDDRKILRKWKDEGHCEGGASGLAITKEFYNAMQHLLWLGYVAYREE